MTIIYRIDALLVVVASIALFAPYTTDNTIHYIREQPETISKVSHVPEYADKDEILDYVNENQIKSRITAQVTGYNTVPEQTDDTPCIAANGKNICGRWDAVACPSNLTLGTRVMIYGRIYECVDRTAEKFNDRFDISCDKDLTCPALVTSIAEVIILK